MKPKLKECSFCKEMTYLWKSNPPACKQCWAKHGAKKPVAKKRKSIKPISDKMAEQLKLYRKKRDEYFKKKPVCEFPGCNSTEITLHHAAGRIGSLLTDETHFRSLCFHHHRMVEDNPDMAKELNLSVSRLSEGL